MAKLTLTSLRFCTYKEPYIFCKYVSTPNLQNFYNDDDDKVDDGDYD